MLLQEAGAASSYKRGVANPAFGEPRRNFFSRRLQQFHLHRWYRKCLARSPIFAMYCLILPCR